MSSPSGDTVSIGQLADTCHTVTETSSGKGPAPGFTCRDVFDANSVLTACCLVARTLSCLLPRAIAFPTQITLCFCCLSRVDWPCLVVSLVHRLRVWTLQLPFCHEGVKLLSADWVGCDNESVLAHAHCDHDVLSTFIQDQRHKSIVFFV